MLDFNSFKNYCSVLRTPWETKILFKIKKRSAGLLTDLFYLSKYRQNNLTLKNI